MKRLALFCLIFLMILLTVFGCNNEKTLGPPDNITLQLKWFHQAQFAGFYVARDKGYFSDENISIIFIEGGPGIDTTDQVVKGNADFAVDSADNIILSKSIGKPVVAISVIYQTSPLIFMSLKSSGITRPQDFEGKRVAIDDAQMDGVIVFYTMMNRLGLDTSNIEIVPFDNEYKNLINGQADVTYTYATGGKIRLEQRGYEVNTIVPDDYGITIYADTIATSEKMIEERPDLVLRFLRASLKGWQDTVSDPEQAVDMIMKYAQQVKDPEIQALMLEASLPHIYTGKNVVGGMESGKWENIYSMMEDQGIIETSFEINKLYTEEFIEKIYEESKN